MSQTRSTSTWGVVIGGWLLAYLALPLWVRSDDPGRNALLLGGLLACFVVALLVLKLLRLPAWPQCPSLPRLVPRAWPLIVLPWLAIQIVVQRGHPLEMGYGDEELHAGVPAGLYDLLTWRTGHDLALWWHIAAWLAVAAVVAVVYLVRRRGLRLPRLFWYVAGPVGLAAYFALYQWLYAHVPQANLDLFRYPPLDPAARLASLLLFGVSETALRLPGLLFALIAAWYTYRFVALEHDESAGVFAATVLLYTPIFMHWSLQVYLVSGQAALVAATVYCFARHLKDGSRTHAASAFLLAGLLVLYERMAAIIAPLMLVALLLWVWRGRGQGRLLARDYLKLFALSLLTMLPWLAITKVLDVRPFLLCPRNWLDLSLVMAYPLRLLSDLTPPLALLALLGLVVALSRYRSWTGIFLAVWGLALYVIYTSDAPEWIPTSRFLAVLAPAWAYFAAVAMVWIKEGFQYRHYWRVATLVAGIWLAFAWFVPQRLLPGAGNDITRWRTIGQPIDPAIRQLARTPVFRSQPLLDMTYCSTSPFYFAKYRMRPPRVEHYSWYTHRGDYPKTEADLLALCRERRCKTMIYALPACLEPYEGAVTFMDLLVRVGNGMNPKSPFQPLITLRGPHGSYHVVTVRAGEVSGAH
ncbi:MAG: glycosyltransferase family 39 protein [Armatimonadia bacterium]